MSSREKQDFLIDICYKLFFIGITIIFLKFVFPYTIPFIIAFGLAAIINKLISKWNNRFIKNHKVVSVSLLIIIYSLLLALSILLISWLITVFSSAVSQVPSLFDLYIKPLLKDDYQWMKNFPEEVQNYLVIALNGIPDIIRDLIETSTSKILSFIKTTITVAPEILIDIVITLVSSFFITIDYEKITKYVKNKIPDKIGNKIKLMKVYFVDKLWNVIKSYIKIMFITFIELFVGLLIFGVDNAFGLSALISLLDILPVLGVGTVLIPWFIICFIRGNSLLGIELLILYIVITIIRNILEPKMVGGDLGLHPVVSLLCMFIGLKMFGLIGLFGFPIGLSFILFATETQKKSS